MKKSIILPADTYIVINRSLLNDNDRKLLTMLYQPLIGSSAISLYFTLWANLDAKEVMSLEYTHHQLQNNIKMKLTDIVEAKEHLEAIGLMKSYVKKGSVNTYVYELYSPLTASDFFNHPLLNIVLYSNVGKLEYDKLLKKFSLPKINLSDYEDITVTFSDIFGSIPFNNYHEAKENLVKRKKSNLTVKSKIDFSLLISSICKDLITDKTFSDDIKDLINNLSFIYNIDTLNMQAIIRNALTERGMIDKAYLRKACRNFYQFEEGGNLPTLIYRSQPDYLKEPVGDISKRAKMIYTFETTTPYDFLKSKYNNAEPTIRDLKLVESLMLDQALKPGVVNVLIDYVLKINNHKLTKAFIETIAGQWKRLNIETVKEAMEIAEKEHKRYKNKVVNPTKKVKSKDNIPDWFDKNIKLQEPTKEEQAKFDELLKEYSE